jgi:hypothetical protein
VSAEAQSAAIPDAGSACRVAATGKCQAAVNHQLSFCHATSVPCYRVGDGDAAARRAECTRRIQADLRQGCFQLDRRCLCNGVARLVSSAHIHYMRPVDRQVDLRAGLPCPADHFAGGHGYAGEIPDHEYTEGNADAVRFFLQQKSSPEVRERKNLNAEPRNISPVWPP